jgi:hypothetical protein
VEAAVTAESPAGAVVQVGDTILRRSAEAATDTRSGWETFQNLSEEEVPIIRGIWFPRGYN